MKKSVIACLILTMAVAAWTVPQTIPQKRDSAEATPPAGSALLDLFIINLRDMGRQGTAESLDRRLQEMMLAAKKAREANEIDAVFFLRFNRILAVTKLVAVPDATGILAPVIEDVLADFVRDKLGHAGFGEEGGKGPKAINYVAQALNSEIVDLQIYLITAEQRAGLKRNIDKMMSETPKK